MVFIKKAIFVFWVSLALSFTGHQVPESINTMQDFPVGKPGLQLTYISEARTLPASVVRKFTLTTGVVGHNNSMMYQWLLLDAEKENGESFKVWLLANAYPSGRPDTDQKCISQYILTKSGSKPVKYINQNNGSPIFPATGAWKYLLPGMVDQNNPFSTKVKTIRLLGLEYSLENRNQLSPPTPPEDPHIIELTPDLLIGIPHNTKVKHGKRRYDDSDYEYVPLTQENYEEMISAGINCFRVTSREIKWLENKNVYYWGIGGKDISYPEYLYRSNYIGPVIFFDEPMVGTRDYSLRPKLREDPDFRKAITPQIAYDEFRKVYHKKKYEEGPARLIRELNEREDVDTGDMDFLQQNIYSWETMVSSAAYQLSEGDNAPPNAMVFEPPGRFGTRRVLPELNMCFSCQIPADDPKNLTGIIYGFLRGAARATQKTWGMSVYGQVDHSDAYWFMTHAYDLGATLFFFWDSHRLAAVPYHEYLALSDNLKRHSGNFPDRDLKKLKSAAEIAILIPPYYNLGHVKMGLGSITGLPELNVERKNDYGIKYRTVMSNFLIEVERCIRLGVAYDLLWDLEGLELKGYREIVTIREDGKVEVKKNGSSVLLEAPRQPERPGGSPPGLSAEVHMAGVKAPAAITVSAIVTEGSAPVYYTMGADSSGVYRNQYVLWELFGPEEEDYTDLWNDRWDVRVHEENHSATVEIHFKVDRPGDYRLRIATADLAGRSAIIWKDIHIER